MSKKRRVGHRADYPKTIKAYAAYHPATGIVWGSIAAKPEWSREFWERHNASAPPPLYIPIRIVLPKI